MEKNKRERMRKRNDMYTKIHVHPTYDITTGWTVNYGTLMLK